MAQILVRGLADEVVERLKARAKAHGRSVEGEMRTILESAAGFTVEEAQQTLMNWQAKFSGREFADSQQLLAEDRDR